MAVCLVRGTTGQMCKVYIRMVDGFYKCSSFFFLLFEFAQLSVFVVIITPVNTSWHVQTLTSMWAEQLLCATFQKHNVSFCPSNLDAFDYHLLLALYHYTPS